MEGRTIKRQTVINGEDGKELFYLMIHICCGALAGMRNSRMDRQIQRAH